MLQFLRRLIYVNLFPLCALLVFFVLLLLSFSCVLSRFCIVFGFCRFLNNPFTLFLRYSVDYIYMKYNETMMSILMSISLHLRLLVKPSTIPHYSDFTTKCLGKTGTYFLKRNHLSVAKMIEEFRLKCFIM